MQANKKKETKEQTLKKNEEKVAVERMCWVNVCLPIYLYTHRIHVCYTK